MRAIKKELPALIVTLQQLYQATGDAEAFGLSTLLSSYAVVSGILFLAEVLDILAKINVAMQRKIIDFSKIPSFVKILVDELRSLKSEESEWCSTVQSTIIKLEEYDIVVGAQRHGSGRSKSARISTLQEYRECVAIPYLDCLIENINRRFTDEAVKILSATSVFDPTKFPTEEALILAYYGLEEIRILADFYGNDATVEYEGTIYTSSPLLDRDELLSEWKTFRRALIQEKKSIMQTARNSQPSLQDILQSMQEYETYKSIFPQMFSLMNILLANPMSTAMVERSFSQMKLVKNRLRNRLSDVSLPQLMRIAIEGPELTDINYEEILDIFAQQNRRIQL